jgi:hypothetical protein
MSNMPIHHLVLAKAGLMAMVLLFIAIVQQIGTK